MLAADWLRLSCRVGGGWDVEGREGASLTSLSLSPVLPK